MSIIETVGEEYTKVCEQIREMDNANKVAPSDVYEQDRAYFMGKRVAFEYLLKMYD
jgi:hypothetical protein